jgi:hypothetical protein
MPAPAAIVARLEPGQDLGGLNGFHDVKLISEQYPDGLELTKGQCIKISNVSSPIGIRRETITLEGKIKKFLDSVAPHHARRIYGIELADEREVVFADFENIYAHHHESMFEDVEVVPCPNGGKRRKHKSIKRRRTHKRKTHRRRKY